MQSPDEISINQFNRVDALLKSIRLKEDKITFGKFYPVDDELRDALIWMAERLYFFEAGITLTFTNDYTQCKFDLISRTP